ILNQSIIKKEFALSGSEQNPDITNRDLKLLLRSRLGKSATGPVANFKEHGAAFVVADTPSELVSGMNKLSGDDLLDLEDIEKSIRARDNEMANPYSKDAQTMGIRNSRRFLGDRLFRAAKPHRLL